MSKVPSGKRTSKAGARGAPKRACSCGDGALPPLPLSALEAGGVRFAESEALLVAAHAVAHGVMSAAEAAEFVSKATRRSVDAARVAAVADVLQVAVLEVLAAPAAHALESMAKTARGDSQSERRAAVLFTCEHVLKDADAAWLTRPDLVNAKASLFDRFALKKSRGEVADLLRRAVQNRMGVRGLAAELLGLKRDSRAIR